MAIEPLVPAATTARRDASGVVATALLGQALGQGLFRVTLPELGPVNENKPR